MNIDSIPEFFNILFHLVFLLMFSFAIIKTIVMFNYGVISSQVVYLILTVYLII